MSNEFEKELLREMLKTLERMDTSVDSINITLAKQEVSLAEHVKRSNLLEQALKDLKENDLKPLERKVNYVEGALKFIGFVLVVASIYKLFF